MEIKKRLLTAEELATILGLNPNTIWKRAADGLIPCVRIGGATRFDSEQIEAWIAVGGKKEAE